MAGAEGWTDAQLGFCEDVAKGLSEYEAYQRHYRCGTGWRANARAMLKRSKIAERIAALRQRTGYVEAQTEDLADLDAIELQQFQDIEQELERTQTPGARIKLLRMRQDLLKRRRTRKPAQEGKATNASSKPTPSRSYLDEVTPLLFTREENAAFAAAGKAESLTEDRLHERHVAVVAMLPASLRHDQN